MSKFEAAVAKAQIEREVIKRVNRGDITQFVPGSAELTISTPRGGVKWNDHFGCYAFIA